MKRKTFWLDVETTGLDPVRNDIIQMACIIEIDGKIVEKKKWNIRPFIPGYIDPKALNTNNMTIEQIERFTNPKEVYLDLISTLDSHVDKYDSSDKFIIAGYNVNFDISFLKSFFEKNGDKYFGSWFDYRPIDIMYIMFYLKRYSIIQIDIADYKLKTICSILNIELDAHDAMNDIEATKKLSEWAIQKIKGV